MDANVDQHIRDIQRQYLDFLDDDADQGYYHAKVRDMIERNEYRLIVNINDLRVKNEERAKKLLQEAFEELIGFQYALKEFVSSADTVYGKKYEEFHIGLEGSFGSKHVSPRTLSARNLGNLICCEGIVTKCSLVSPKVVKSVHFCQKTKKSSDRRYTDMTSLNAFPSSTVYPTKDEDGNPLETEFGLSVYKDHQTYTIQEMPEKAPAGQLPRSVDIIVDNDLVDTCKPGDRVQIIGVFRCLPSKRQGYTPGTFRTILIANNVKVMSKEVQPNFSPDDLTKMKRFSKSKEHDVFDLLSKSLAPSIHGHDYIKKAILCLLLGGSEKVLDNGTRLRGDINIMMVGDPSTAKSQLLRYVLHTAPRAIATTGRGSSGVGLTAAVTTDQETGERRLEAGAMVLADRGVVCIDEFDKMSDMDRTAIHEVMEQGRVTIAKAGIHAKLNARCSVLAAANPVYGRYDPYKTPMDNIGMQDSLLSRFDLLFIVLDQMDPESDKKISEHVLRMHKYRNPGEQDGDPLPFGDTSETLSTYANEEQEEQEGGTPLYAKRDNQLYGAKSKKERFVSAQFMKKYIHVARNIKPSLSQKAVDLIVSAYSDLRDQEGAPTDKAMTAPVTARTLETMIRLSTAHAKARMSKSIDKIDAEAAIEMVEFAYFHKVESRKKKKAVASEESEGEEASDDEAEVETTQASQDKPKQRKRKKKDADADTDSEKLKMKKQKKQPGDEGYDPYDFDDEEGEPSSTKSRRQRKSKSADDDEEMDTTADKSSKKLSEERFQIFRSSLQALFSAEHVQTLPLQRIVEKLNKDYPDSQFGQSEVDAAVERMTDDNHIMLSDGQIFLV